MTAPPPGPGGATCATCLYWGGRPSGLARDKGRSFPCRRHAPLPSRGGQRGAELPYVPHDFWCGEHRPLPGQDRETSAA